MEADRRYCKDYFTKGRIRVDFKDERGDSKYDKIETKCQLLSEIAKLVPEMQEKYPINKEM